jgi:hypothetical protein
MDDLDTSRCVCQGYENEKGVSVYHTYLFSFLKNLSYIFVARKYETIAQMTCNGG